MDAGRELRHWTASIRHYHLPIAPLVYTIFHAPISTRKVMLNACRVQPPDFHSLTRFRTRHSDALSSNIPFVDHPGPGPYPLMTLADFLTLHHSFFSTPILCGFISMLVRFLPYSDYSSVFETKKETLHKELVAAVSLYHPVTLDYTSIFGSSTSSRGVPIHSGHACPPVSAEIHKAMGKARLKCTTMIHVPRVSTKTILIRHPVDYEFHERSLRRSRRIRTLRDVEEVYVRSGIRLQGLTELRSAWKGNDLKPRVYYARGPEVHFASSIIQSIFNVFVDSLPMTHRRNRFNLADLDGMDPDTIMMIYDYSSFTSTLHEIRNFTEALADFCTGYSVCIIDGHDGPQYKDLGDVLRDYNQVCNIEAEFDCAELLEVTEMVLSHNTGMLGVPGNISSCTLLHGIHLAIILGSLSRGKVIGDDAMALIFAEMFVSRESLAQSISAIGRIAMEKMEWWTDEDCTVSEGWSYEKRPLHRYHEIPVKGSLINWPSINVLFGIINPFHKPLHYTPSKAFVVATRQIARFQTSLFPLELSTLDQEIVLMVVRQFYHHHGLKRFSDGYIGGVEIYGDWVEILLPPANSDFFTVSPRDFLRSHPGSHLNMPPDHCDVTERPIMTVGNAFYSYPSGLHTYLEKMDFLEAEKVSELTLVQDISEWDIDNFLYGRLKFPYRYVIADPLPLWCVDML